MKLYLIRHAESHGNTKGKIISTTDFELTEKGIAQSLRIGQRLCAELEGKPVSDYCSCLARARQTLQEILRCIGQQDAVITQSHCLKEMDDAHSVIVVSHGITLRILTNLLLNRPDSDVNDLNWGLFAKHDYLALYHAFANICKSCFSKSQFSFFICRPAKFM